MSPACSVCRHYRLYAPCDALLQSVDVYLIGCTDSTKMKVLNAAEQCEK